MSLRRSALITVIATSILVACNNKEDNDTTNQTSDQTSDQTSGQTSDDTGANIEKSDAVAGAPDPAMFQDNALTEEVSTIDCTLSDGTETSCYRISIAGKPSTMDEGPLLSTEYHIRFQYSWLMVWQEWRNDCGRRGLDKKPVRLLQRHCLGYV